MNDYSNKPIPTGSQFRELFKQIFISSKHTLGVAEFDKIKCFQSNALNKDINLYRAMLIVLSMIYPLTSIDIYNEPSINPLDFMKSQAMVALKDNEYASMEHENKSRKECYDYVKKLIK